MLLVQDDTASDFLLVELSIKVLPRHRTGKMYTYLGEILVVSFKIFHRALFM